MKLKYAHSYIVPKLHQNCHKWKARYQQKWLYYQQTIAASIQFQYNYLKGKFPILTSLPSEKIDTA